MDAFSALPMLLTWWAIDQCFTPQKAQGETEKRPKQMGFCIDTFAVLDTCKTMRIQRPKNKMRTRAQTILPKSKRSLKHKRLPTASFPQNQIPPLTKTFPPPPPPPNPYLQPCISPPSPRSSSSPPPPASAALRPCWPQPPPKPPPKTPPTTQRTTGAAGGPDPPNPPTSPRASSCP